MGVLQEAAGLRPSQTPRTLLWLWDEENGVNDALAILGTLAEITFPLPCDEQSPAKKNKSPTHEIKRLFSQLYFTKREALEYELIDFIDYLDGRTWNDEHKGKLQYLQRALSAVNGEHVRSRRSPHANRVFSLAAAEEPDRASTPSPTTLTKHAPISISKDMEAVHLSPSANITSNSTSANTSFSTEAQNGSQDPSTPATEIDEEFTTDDGPSQAESTVSTFQGKMAAAGVPIAPGYSGLGLDGALDLWNTQETYYGSSPRESQIPDDIDLQYRNSTLSQSPVTGTESPKSAADMSSEAAVNKSSGLTTNTSREDATERLPGATEDAPIKTRASKSSEAVASAKKSPDGVCENVHVRRIATDGLTDIRLPPDIAKLDVDLRSAFYRVAQDCKIDPQDLAQRWAKPRTLSALSTIANDLVPGFRPLGTISHTEYSLRAKMRFADSLGGRLMIMEHLRAQKQLPNLLEMVFGSHRFLTVDVDPLNPPPRFGLGDQVGCINQRFQEMIAEPQEFLGCMWIQFYAQERSRRKVGEEPTQSGAMQYVFFATRGPGLEPIDLYTVLNAAVYFSRNLDMSLCKLYARIDLAMSRTYFVEMKPSEIQWVDDDYGTSDPEDTRFNDPNLDFSTESKKKTIMNDGCGVGLLQLFRRIREKFGLAYLITGIQLRCAGSKGVVTLERPTLDDLNQSGPSVSVLLRLPESMRKFMMPDAVFQDSSPNNYAIYLRIVQFVHPLKPSYLYSDFLPILIDRHVPSEAIEELTGSQADKDVQDFQEALSSSDSMRSWLYNQYRAREDQRRDSEIETIGSFPTASSEKAIQMLEAGFEPTTSRALAELIQSISTAFFNQRQKAYKIPLAKSTMAIAVADCGKYLKPGEVQLNFSGGFIDPDTGLPMYCILGDALVARSPSARPSDVQKVTFVFRPELSHIMDQVIFPTTGDRPLASKLSGGDYDGDKMWICWDRTLVDSFLNAPAPVTLPDPTSMGIKVDNVVTSEVISGPPSEVQARAFVRKGTANRMRGSLLGVVTKSLERQIYADNSMATAKARALADLKDTIIDSDKNGYMFDRNDLAAFNKAHGISALPHPAYTKVVGKNDDPAREYAPVNPGNILDKVHCLILPAKLKKAEESMNVTLADAVEEDEALMAEYDERLIDARDDPDVHAELSRLEGELKEVRDEWYKRMGIWKQAKRSDKALAWDDAVLRCRGMLEAIEPTTAAKTHPVIREWLRQRGSGPATWNLIKASALATFYYKGKMLFSIAGHELCILKSRDSGPTRTLLTRKYLQLKPRKRKGAADDVVDEVVDEQPDEIDENGVDMDE